jgi:hypothetical protein
MDSDSNRLPRASESQAEAVTVLVRRLVLLELLELVVATMVNLPKDEKDIKH